MEDAPALTSYINELSSEDTFITLSGEQMTLEEEEKYLSDFIEKMERGDAVKLFAFIGEKLVGVAGLTRIGRRSKHVGRLGISIRKDYRQEGIGTSCLRIFLLLPGS